MAARLGAIVAVAAVLALVAGGPALPQDTKPLPEVPANSAPPPPAPETVASMPKPPPEPPLPVLPPAPQFDASGYPGCREDWQKLADPYARADATTACTKALDAYYADVMTPFVKVMSAHQDEISRLYTDKVARNPDYLEKSKQAFYAAMMAEHARSDPDGANMATWRATADRYHADRDYLQDRFCFNTGCGGYPKPDLTAAKPEPKGTASTADKGDDKKAKRSKKASKKDDGCGGSRKAGGVLGGLIGGIAGSNSGLGRVGTALASGLTGVLVGEIACKLTREEQEKAAEATVEVTKKEEVGATAKWISPTRSGVSGSSTVTALNAEPNGRKCLSITDVAIIDGEETRVSKQMCRKPGEARYTLVA